MEELDSREESARDKVLALIPAFNEANSIEDVVTGSLAQLPVLVVDDGSSDDTSARAEEAGATVLRQVPNQGKGAALQAGFRWAIERDYQAVLTLDADGQHDPAEIPAFLEVYHGQHPDLVIGERDFSQMPAQRRLANSLGRWVFSWALGEHVRDNQSGYRLVSRRLMQALLAGTEQGFEFEMEMIATCVQRGYKLEWVPIRTIYAGETSHINNSQHVINFLRVARETRKRTHTRV